jgi:hypothetical protein
MFNLSPIYRSFLQMMGPLYLQHDYNVANDTGSAVRADINNLAQAIATVNSGATAPSTTFAYQLWADTTAGLLKQRNAANTSWLVRGSLTESFVIARSSNTILGVADFGRSFIATSTFTQTLTAAATLGDGWFCHYRNDGIGVITLDPNASEQIDGSTTLKLLPGESCVIWCNGTAFKTIGRTISKNTVSLLENVGLSVSVAGNAITVALKDEAGNDPAPGSPVRIGFRDATLTTGTPVVREITAAASITASSGSTLGTVSGQAHRIYIIGVDDAGTFRMGLWNPWDNTNKTLVGINEDGLYSSTAEGGAGAADSPQVLYTGTAVTSKAVRILGYFESTQTTAGTWAAEDSKVQVMGEGVHRTGDVVQVQRTQTGAAATGTTQIPNDNTTPQNTEGDQYMSLAITPTSVINLLSHDIRAHGAHSAATAIIGALFQDSTVNALASSKNANGNVNVLAQVSIGYVMPAGTTAATTFKFRMGAGAAGTTTFNGESGAGVFNATLASYMNITEIFV